MIKVSACVITKNEEKNIGAWLQGVQSIADEWIVVDTGSEDATVAIAKSAGAQVYSFAWCGDFSAAKNFALDQAKGSWIIFLDADECFSPSSLPKVREYIRRFNRQTRLVGIVCPLTNIDVDDHDRVKGSIKQVRIFRNLPDIRYTGQIHETLENLAVNKRHLEFVAELEIIHTGYSSQRIHQKLVRNLEMLQERIRQQGKKPEDAFYLMDCFYGLGDYEKAIQYAREAIRGGVRFIGMEGHVHMCLLSAMIQHHESYEEVFKVLSEAKKQYPEGIGFLLVEEWLYWQEKDYPKSESLLDKLFAMRSRLLLECSYGTSDDAERFWPYAYLHWGMLAQMRFQSETALERYSEGLHYYPQVKPLFARFYACIANCPPVDIIAFLNTIYSRDTDAGVLADMLRGVSAGPVYLYYAKKAGQLTGESLFDYLQAGRYDAVLAAGTDELSSLYRLGICSAEAMGLSPEQTTLSLLLPADYRQAWKSRIQPLEPETETVRELRDRLTNMLREFGQMNLRAEGLSVGCEAKIQCIVARAAELFSAGHRQESFQVLLDAYKKDSQEPVLAYSLAYILNLMNEKEGARRVLLSQKRMTADICELWKELQTDADFPLVSIMIPTFNRPEYFEQTLRSACAQTYTNVEIIICDNSTNDVTEKLMKKYQQDLRIRYYRNRDAKTKEENFHPFEQLAKGEFLQWLMDDDLLAKDKLRKMVRAFQKNPRITLATSERGIIDEAGRALPRPYHNMVKVDGEYGVCPGKEMGHFFFLTMANFLGEPSAVLFRRRDLSNHYWNADCRGYKTISDVVMWLELLEKGECAFFKEPLSYYRRHSGQEGQQVDVILLSRIEWYRILLEYDKKQRFAISPEEYQAFIKRLYLESKEFLTNGYADGASADMRQKYCQVMQTIGQELREIQRG